jgi:hypothetical protein
MLSRFSSKHGTKADDLSRILPKGRESKLGVIPNWKISIWEREYVDPAILRVPIILMYRIF